MLKLFETILGLCLHSHITGLNYDEKHHWYYRCLDCGRAIPVKGLN